MSKPQVIFWMLVVAAVSSLATIQIVRIRSAPSQPVPISEEDYFTNEVFSDNAQEAKTVEAMVKRCESAEIVLKAAAGQIMPALQPMSNEEAAKRLVEIGICVGSLGTFAKVKFPGRVCLPAHRLTPIQAIRIFLKWAQDNPARLEAPFTVGYLGAFENAFPCPNER
jgi:Ssp1 endopeptidase immunity protein Rap1a